ncbi:MAG TPA: DUF4412 domain-containing protein [Hanamia sp.]
MKQIKIFAAILFLSMCFISCNTNSSAPSGSSGNITSGSGKDIYIEMTSDTKGAQIQMQNLIKMYLSDNGKARVEMDIMKDGKYTTAMVSIGDANNPYQSTLLDDSAKSYIINHVDSADLNSGDGSNTKYAVSKIGQEQIAGFNCTHARIIANKTYNGPASFKNSIDTTDLWLSPDVPIPDAEKKYMEMATSKMSDVLFNADVVNQLKQMGCEGFMIKFDMNSKDVASTNQITKVTRQDFPAGMFEVPQGYKQTSGD